LRGEEIRERERVRAAMAAAAAAVVVVVVAAVAARVKIRRKEESGYSEREKNPREETLRDRRESKYTAGGNIGPHTRSAVQHTRARSPSYVLHVCARVWDTHTRTRTRCHVFTHARTHAHTRMRARARKHTDRSHGRAATPTHRLHTYVGTVHIKLGGCALSFAAAQE